jgi:hypothetical protein
MPAVDDRFARLTLTILPVCIVIIGCGICLLPRHAIVQLVELFIAWLSLSVPIGILAGHCMLGDRDFSEQV